ncbi:MAG: hypothetical protein NZL91_02155 [Thermoflexales bacterium]|nr:hypothetical protein [Thermoflexales bacterium]MDW8054777.1 hypothetical protein [Anaerolineae bacterium]MDW8292895.1 hypothetical protein [Anaerolineae bacterium]
MWNTPERRAWLILFAALFTCCALAVGVPASTWALINSATAEAPMEVRLRAGILKTFSRFEQERDARVVALEGRAVEEGTTLIAGPESVGLLTVGGSSSDAPAINIQLYADTRLRLDRARYKRFHIANRADEFVFALEQGRVQIVVEASAERRFTLHVHSDLGTVSTEMPGAYSIERAGEELRVFVAQGIARVADANAQRSIQVSGGQRTLITRARGLAGVLPPVRNLIRNGNFTAPLSRDWEIETLVIQGSTVTGTATIRDAGGRPALFLERTGSGISWGRTGVRQVINENVVDRRSLQLRIDFRILYQEIPVCGGEGSECPLMVRIDYRTKDGRDAFWIQGFYASGTPSGTSLPDYIRSNPQNKHIARRLNAPEPPFESGNLLALIPDMQIVKSISIYAEGHAVRTQVNTVELLLQD